MLGTNEHQGLFGEDYVRVLASAAGLVVYTPGRDSGIDFVIRRYDGVAAGIDIQVKSWSTPRKSGGAYHYDRLTETQFNKLAGPGFLLPRYLFLVIVPGEIAAYAEILTDGMLLRYQSFYTSLRDETPIADPSRHRHRVVRVPVGNLLTTRSLRALLPPDPRVPVEAE